VSFANIGGPKGDCSKIVAIEDNFRMIVQMNTTAFAKRRMVARVAIDVRLYFDVPIESEDAEVIQRAAHEELQRVAYEESIRVTKLRFANISPTDDWHTVQPNDFQVCQICSAGEANKDTRFAL
jgi:hypothetical protein